MSTSTPAPPPARTTFTNHRDTYQAALRSLFSGAPEAAEADVARLFTPNFRQEGDNDSHDYAGWVVHVRWLREMFAPDGVNLNITHFFREGDQCVDRHSGTSEMADGTVSHSETFMWAEIAEDGRISRLVETVINERRAKSRCPCPAKQGRE